jgi:lipopolysaccharide/colanic/teichoic acid biosynthesis glycosyltransferase
MSQKQSEKLRKSIQNDSPELAAQFEAFRRALSSPEVAPYAQALARRRGSLAAKRVFDIFASGLCIAVLSPVFAVSAAAVGLGSKGPVFYRQLRVGRGGEPYYVLKFRTMRVGADKSGEITVGSRDGRITRVGRLLRATNLDEMPQFLQVFSGRMSIVGVRPEVPHYVAMYSPEDFATLLMRPGLTSPVALSYRHENDMLTGAADPEKFYTGVILPAKMELNRKYVREFSFGNDMRILGATFRCLFEKDETLEKMKSAASQAGENTDK